MASRPVVVEQARTADSQFVLWLLYLLFFLSGFSALIYQTAWQRLLGLFGGSDSISATLVVGAFLLGLGLGSLLASTFADRLSRRRARFAFALCEVGIAAFAIVSKLIFYDVLFGKMNAIASDRSLVFLIAFLTLLLPTLLMGLSLPLLARSVVQNIDTASRRIGWLYGVNTLGAAVGAFAGGCYIIGTVGYEATVYVAAMINMLVGAGALLLAAKGDADTGPLSAHASTSTVPPAVWQWCLLVFASGFIIISLEIVWFRVIGIMLQGTAYSFSLVLGFLLLGDALGIIIGVLVLKRIASPGRFFLWLQGAVTLCAIASVWMMAVVHEWPAVANMFVGGGKQIASRPTPGDMGIIVASIALLVVPSATLIGMSFPITQKAIQDDPAVVGQRVGLIQVSNILGNTAGAIVTGLVLLHHFGTPGTLRVLAIVGLLFMAGLLLRQSRAGVGLLRQRLAHGALAACLVIVAARFPDATYFWGRLHVLRPGENVILAEDRTGLALMKYDSPSTGHLYIAGHSQSAVPFLQIHMVLGFLGGLVHPNPKSMLVVGHGAGGTPYGAGAIPSIERVRVVEIVAPVYHVMSRFGMLGGKTAVDRLLSDRRYERLVGDARHVLFTDRQRYDVIEADAIYAHTSHSGFLYSVEYFRQLFDRLQPGGIVVQWAPTRRTVNSFLAAFPHVVELTGVRVMLGSDRPIPFDPKTIALKLQNPAIRSYLAEAQWNSDAISKLLREQAVRIWGPDEARPGDVNTDLFPKDEFYLNPRKITIAWPF